MNRKNLYVFDFGDTLVSYPLNTWDNQITFIETFLSDFIASKSLVHSGKTPRELAEELNVERQNGETVPFISRIVEPRFFDPAIDASMANILEKEIVEAACKSAKIFDDALVGIERVKARGCQVAIMSNLPWGTSSSVWRAEFERHGFKLGLNVDAIVCCVDVGFRKPHPEGLLSVMRSLNATPEETVFIGDNPEADLKAAERAGCDFILINRGHHVPPAGTRVIQSLMEL